VSNLKVKTRLTEDKHFKMIAGGVTMDFFNLFIVFIHRKSRSGTEFQSFVQDEGQCSTNFCEATYQPIRSEVDWLESQGIRIKKAEFFPWGTEIVPVVKGDGRIRLCADNKVTVNQHLLDDKNPIAKIEEIFTKMTGRKFFVPWMFCSSSLPALTSRCQQHSHANNFHTW
jgi:hypothetical protein